MTRTGTLKPSPARRAPTSAWFDHRTDMCVARQSTISVLTPANVNGRTGRTVSTDRCPSHMKGPSRPPARIHRRDRVQVGDLLDAGDTPRFRFHGRRNRGFASQHARTLDTLRRVEDKHHHRNGLSGRETYVSMTGVVGCGGRRDSMNASTSDSSARQRPTFAARIRPDDISRRAYSSLQFSRVATCRTVNIGGFMAGEQRRRSPIG